MMQSRTLLILAALLLFAPPLLFTCISLFLLFMVLTEPWGWLALFLLLGLPLGTLLVGLIIRYGGQSSEQNHHQGQKDGEKRSGG